MRVTFGQVLPEMADGLARAAIKLASPLVVFAAITWDFVPGVLVGFIGTWVVMEWIKNRRKRS